MFAKTAIYKFEAPGVGGDTFADPLALRRALLAGTSGRCWEWARQARELEKALEGVGDATGETADAQRAEWSAKLAEVEGYLVGAAMQAFNLTPLDPATGFGCTELAALELLYDFLEWLEGKASRPGT